MEAGEGEKARNFGRPIFWPPPFEPLPFGPPAFLASTFSGFGPPPSSFSHFLFFVHFLFLFIYTYIFFKTFFALFSSWGGERREGEANPNPKLVSIFGVDVTTSPNKFAVLGEGEREG